MLKARRVLEQRGSVQVLAANLVHRLEEQQYHREGAIWHVPLKLLPLCLGGTRLKWMEATSNLPTDLEPGLWADWEREHPAFGCLSEDEWAKVILRNVKLIVSLVRSKEIEAHDNE